MWRAAFPDFAVEVHDTIAEGDKVVTRWSMRGTHLGEYNGIPATGRVVGHGAISIDRVQDGLITDEWIEFDQYGLLRQLRGE
jgi:steroid delta-isomerase-like uncharacterized protein